jgi:CubicO group peptidase (beta-lactamase class C family)
MRLRSAAMATALVWIGAAHADNIDDLISAEMKKRQIPGLSIAIIEGGKIVKAQGYGVTELGGKTAVTAATLFQAGSISKPVAALGALLLVEQGKLALDEDVNRKLLAWKVPENAFTAEKKVTLRGLLSHSAGLTVHGFAGYAIDEPAPTVGQILNGEKPANSRPVRVDILPGSTMRYSGGGYTVMQQLMDDVTGKPFAEFMRDAVLLPMGMQSSSYLQPPPPDRARANASGYYADRRAVQGRWHIYPEMAAAGLWTNPSDLARFAIGVQRSLAGSANPVISAGLARQWLSEQKPGVGLGLFLKGVGKEQQFSHGGRDEGFDSLLVATSESGQGAVIMINANDNSRMKDRIVAAIASEYKWPGAQQTAAANDTTLVPVDAKVLESYGGRYEIGNNMMTAFMPGQGRLISLTDGLPDEEFFPTGPRSFFSASRKMALTFEVNEQGAVTAVAAKLDGKERKGARIGPMMRGLSAQNDPQPARTAMIKTVLDDFSSGNLNDAAPLTPGSRKDLGISKVAELAGLSPLAFLREESVAGRPIERHGGKVDRVLFYQASIAGKPKYLMVYLTADGLFTDYDVVDL